MQGIVKAGLAGLLVMSIAGCGKSGQQPSGTETGAAASPAASETASAAAAPAASGAAAPVEFAICQSCHSIQPGQSLVGPSLAGVFGRKAGSVDGYAYSDAVKGLGVTWDETSLDKWLTNPAAMAPGTKMTFAGYADPAQRKAVIDYLKTLK